MPSNIKRQSRQQRMSATLTSHEMAYLFDDDSLLDGKWAEYGLMHLRSGEKTKFKNDSGLTPAELWEKYREWVLPQFVKKQPGRRPCGWWLVDAPEQRKLKCGGYDQKWQKIISDSGDEWAPSIRSEHWRLNYGVPGMVDHFDDDLNEIEDKRVFESQVEYLKRLDLLLPGEKA